MTENEAIKMLEQGDKYFFEVDFTYEECLESIEMGRKALEEIQQYRAIGTVEEFKAYKLGDCMNDCEHYENCSNYIYSKGYKKAIDDLVTKCKQNTNDMFGQKYVDVRVLDTLAEQLKGE